MPVWKHLKQRLCVLGGLLLICAGMCGPLSVAANTVPLFFGLHNPGLQPGKLQYPNTEKQRTAVMGRLLALEMRPTPDLKRQVLSRFVVSTNTRRSNDITRLKKLFALKKKPLRNPSAEALAVPAVLDLDQNGSPDLILFSEGYFGPSYGYAVYALHQGKLRYQFDNSGWFTRFQRRGRYSLLRYTVTIIDPNEATILYTLALDHRSGKVRFGPTLYYATQSILPATLGKPRVCTVRAARVDLRYCPGVRDTRRPGFGKGMVTMTLGGNVVARYAKGVSCRLLARTGGWGFVAFPPRERWLACSLAHGLGRVKIKYDPFRAVYTPGSGAWPAGWVPLSSLTCGK